ncbi:MAG: hypothetical protein WB421_09955 [Terriglobales bacterium]
MKELFVAVLFGATLCMPNRAAFAQDVYSIHVESNQVLVPTFVYDKTRMTEPPPLPPMACPMVNSNGSDEKHSVPKALTYCDESVVIGLTAKDFHLFEDGKEQSIQRVRTEPMHNLDVRDNVGHYIDDSDTPRGKWSTSDLPPRFSADILRTFFYLIAYVPPASTEGSCHQIKVKVDRRNSYVYARSQYCNTQHSASDPLNGTEFGKKLEGYLASGQADKIGLSLQTGFFYTNADPSRVDIALEFPWNSLKRGWNNVTLYATIGVLGMVYRKDGTLASRFSDLGCCPSDRPEFARGSISYQTLPDFDVVSIPAGYETQMDLPPGEYNLKVALSDGSKFGRVEMPLTVDSYDGKQLAISSVVLCKRFSDAASFAVEAVAVNLAPKLIPLISKGIRYTPAGDTRFKKGESLFAYFEVYEPFRAGQPSPTIQTRLKITNIKTGELRVDTGLRSEASGSAVIPIANQIAVDKLPAGSYRLEVQASDSAGESTVWRAAEFTVE